MEETSKHAAHRDPDRSAETSFWKMPLGWVFLGFAAIAAFFLIAEHTAHVIGFLPWLLLLACPLMHIFGHRHGGHGRRQPEQPDEPKTPRPDDGKSPHRH